MTTSVAKWECGWRTRYIWVEGWRQLPHFVGYSLRNSNSYIKKWCLRSLLSVVGVHCVLCLLSALGWHGVACVVTNFTFLLTKYAHWMFLEKKRKVIYQLPRKKRNPIYINANESLTVNGGRGGQMVKNFISRIFKDCYQREQNDNVPWHLANGKVYGNIQSEYVMWGLRRLFVLPCNG